MSVRSRHDLLRRLRRRPLGLAGLIGAGLFVLIAVVGPWVSPYDPLAQKLALRLTHRVE